MPDSAALLAFFLANLAMNFLPGPDLLLILGRSIRSGTKHGMVTVLGLVSGILLHGLFAIFGLTSILLASSLAFSIIKYLGALYLCYLGVRMLLSKSTLTLKTVDSTNLRSAFWQGFLTDALNPKMALWFFAFLPQFIDTSRGAVSNQFAVLLFVQLLAILPVSLGIAAVAGSVSRWFSRHPRFLQWQERIFGTTLISFGLILGFSENR